MDISFIGEEALYLLKNVKYLNLGKILSAEVIETSGDRVFLDVGGKVLSAKTSLNFTQGQKLRLLVSGMNDGEIILKLQENSSVSGKQSPISLSNASLKHLIKAAEEYITPKSVEDVFAKLEKTRAGVLLNKFTINPNEEDKIQETVKTLRGIWRNTAALVQQLEHLDQPKLVKDFLNLVFRDVLMTKLDHDHLYYSFPLKVNDSWEFVQLKIKIREKGKEIDLSKKLRVNLKISTKNLGEIVSVLLLQENELVTDIRLQNSKAKQVIEKQLEDLKHTLKKFFNCVYIKCRVQSPVFREKPLTDFFGFEEGNIDLRI